MKGSITAVCLSMLLGMAGGAGAATAVLDFSDPTKNSNATLVANADGATTVVTEGGVQAVRTSGSDDGTEGAIYVNVQDDLFNDSQALWVRVDYFDQGTDTFQIEYDTADDAYLVANPVRLKFDTRTWLSQTVKLVNFQLQGRQEGGSDIRINDLGDGPEIIRQVIVTDEDPDKIHFPKVDPAKPITIDGVKAEGEWDGAFSVTLNRAQQDAYNGSNWDGPQDYSGTYSYKWSEQGLYILGEVTDATPRLNDATGTGYWNGDGLEQFISLDPDPNRTTFDAEKDFQVVISMGDPEACGGEGPAWAVHHGGLADFPAEDKGVIPAQNVSVVNTDTGYMFELLLPWTLLKADATVTEGQNIGWSMFGNNSIDCPSAQQVAMSPWGRTGPSGNPSRWATAVLQGVVVETPPAAGQ